MIFLVSSLVEEKFKKRLQLFIELLKEYQIEYDEVGIFGSYARGNYKTTSDIDIAIITDNRPDMRTSGSFREEAELLGVDVVYMTRESFEYSNRIFSQRVRKEYVKLL